MAAKTIVYQVSLRLTDSLRQRDLSREFSLIRNPAEKLERMMLRLIAWVLFADDALCFNYNASSANEPELWIKDSNQDIKLWITIGLPNEKILNQSCNRAEQVVLFTQHDKAALQWKKHTLHKLDSLQNLMVINISDEVLHSAAQMVQASMNIEVQIQDGQLSFSVNGNRLLIEPQTWKIDSF